MIGHDCLPVGSMQANCWLLWDENGTAVLIDPGDEPDRLLRVLKDRRLTLGAILLTHAHFDHLMAVPALREQTDAPLCIHEAEAITLGDARRNLTPYTGTPLELTADRLLTDGETVTVGSMTFTVLHTPGHTPGGCCYRIGDRLFTGDTLFAGSMGRTDFPGGSGVQLKDSLRRLAALEESLQVLPGHEGTSTIGREKKINPFMRGL